ncbi:MAG: serine protease [Mucilaginibacter sp.]
MSENQLLDVIERYLNGEMSLEELKKFELLRKESADVDGKVVEHQNFTNLLKQYGERVELENRLNAIHDEIDVHSLKESLMAHPIWIVQLWRHHHSKISVAASVAIFAILSIMALTGKFDNNNSKIVELKSANAKLNQKIGSINKSINDIKAGKNVVINDRASSTGTGFALTADGLIATNYHVIQGADSVYIQNSAGKSFKASVLYTEPQHDIAILRVVDDSFNLSAIPYTFKKSESDIAEDVHTLGYPNGEQTYNKGWLSTKTGLNGDSVHYQISIPTNPGNSGSPLWDSKGNIIGITDAKQAQYEGTHFAIKTRYLLDAIHNIPADSLHGKSVTLNKKNTLAGLPDVQRTQKMKKYTFMVKVYN